MNNQFGYCCLLLLFSCFAFSQEITLFEQFNGRYDFTFIGKTLNTGPNGMTSVPCIINTESSAELNLLPEQTIQKAYLYWAGSGNGDFEVKLNGVDIVPDETRNLIQVSSNLIFFSAMKDVTAQVLATGNGMYTFSDMDLNAIIPAYCPNGTNFGGWAMVIIYQNNSLPLNQINVYSGLDYVSVGKTSITFTLDSLNVIDEIGAKIGVVAWEGDHNILDGEALWIKDQKLSSPLNPENNVFNGTNSITGDQNSYNMDLDIFDIQDNIDVGDTSVEVKVTSDRDFVMINALVTKLNSQLPDATVIVGNLQQQCDSRFIKVDYTVSNLNSTDVLESAVPIAIFANDTYIEYAETLLPIPIGGSEEASITLEIPNGISNDFILRFVVDQNGAGIGTIKEIVETNNVFEMPVSLWTSPTFNPIPNPESCDIGFGKGEFDLVEIETQLRTDDLDTFSFHQTFADADAKVNPIPVIGSYTNDSNPDELFIRIENQNCFTITSLNLIVKKCLPIVYNLVEPSGNNFYDFLYIKGLRNVFTNFNLNIYNRWGSLVWNGNNTTDDWRGNAIRGNRLLGNELTEGTYFYVLELNDNEYPNPMSGFIYLKR